MTGAVLWVAGALLGALNPPEVFDVLRLPPAVQVRALSYNNGSSDPFERLTAKVGNNWTQGTQETWEGDLGFVPRTVVHGEDGVSLRVELSRSTGTKDEWFKLARVSIIDPLVSPIGWLRLAALSAERGGFTSSASGDKLHSAFEVELGPYGRQFVDIDWDGLADSLVVKAGRVREHRTVYTYSAWKSIGAGVRHPSSVEIVYDDGPEPFRKLVTIESLAVLPIVAPPVPRFAASVFIRDAVSKETLDGELQPVKGTVPQGLVFPSSPSARTTALRAAPPFWSWAKVTGVLLALITCGFGVIVFRRYWGLSRQ